MIQLNYEVLATDEDISYGIDKWVRLFKAKTWEELKMVAQDNSYMTSTVESMYLSNADKKHHQNRQRTRRLSPQPGL